MWRYKNDDGAEMVIHEENHKSMLEREGFKLVSEVVYDKKGKLIDVVAQTELAE